MIKEKEMHVNGWIYGACLVLLVISFQFNGLETVADTEYAFFQYDSQALVVGRLAYARKEGIFSGNGFIGSVHTTPDDTRIGYQYAVYEKEKNITCFEPYRSQPGGQGICYSLCTKILGIGGANGLWILQFLTSIFTACIFVGFLRWVRHIGGQGVMGGVFISIVLCSWIVLFARNLYWVLGIFYLAFVVELWLLERVRQSGKWRPRIIYSLIFLAVWLKGWLTGFDYISTYIIMLIVPFLFYAIWLGWSFKEWILRFSGLGGVVLLAFVIVMGMLLFQLSGEMGSWEKAVDYIIYALGKRSYGGENPEIYTPSIREGIGCSLPGLLNTYWKSNAMDLSHWFEINFWKSLTKVTYEQLTWVFIAFSGWVTYKKWKKNADRSLEWALMISLWVSLLAPLSWFIIFKGHSYVHVHMNNIVWQMPYVLWGIVFVGVVIRNSLKRR